MRDLRKGSGDVLPVAHLLVLGECIDQEISVDVEHFTNQYPTKMAMNPGQFGQLAKVGAMDQGFARASLAAHREHNSFLVSHNPSNRSTGENRP